MARGLGLSVVAEGVEETEQMDYLKAQGCHEFQGFLVSMPIPADDYTAFLEAAQLGGWPAAVANAPGAR